jgi:uncharacterized protein YgiM (DUF1202 family)
MYKSRAPAFRLLPVAFVTCVLFAAINASSAFACCSCAISQGTGGGTTTTGTTSMPSGSAGTSTPFGSAGTSTTSGSAQPDVTMLYVVVARPFLYMRYGPGMNYGTCGKIPYGTYLNVETPTGPWPLVSYNSDFGYVNSNYLALVD